MSGLEHQMRFEAAVDRGVQHEGAAGLRVVAPGRVIQPLPCGRDGEAVGAMSDESRA